MLRQYAAFFFLLRSVVDIVIINSCWIAVYFIRFRLGIFSITKGIPDFKEHLILSLPIMCICWVGCLWTGLYKPRRIHTMSRQLLDLLKATLLNGLLMLAFFYYAKDVPYSRKLLILFVIMLFLGLTFSHLLVIRILRFWRKKGYNLRYYAVIGAGKKAQTLVQDIRNMRWTGLKCVFFADNEPDCIGKKLLGVPVRGPVDKVPELVKAQGINEVYLAMEGSEAQNVYPVLESLQCAGVTIRIIPNWGNLVSISDPVVVPVGSQVLFSSAVSPLNGCNIILKRSFDLLTSSLLLVLSSLPMLIIMLLIKFTSRGPVFYRQARTGMDQEEFEMLKFRTMKTDTEKQSQPQWCEPDDDRCTLVGKWLRKTCLDELPQLVNVVKGQMSLVGPRPERPCIIKGFSEKYKKYMLRHKVKAGITGWAQVNGLRGDTSLRKRLVYDLYYIRNWSFTFDLWILLRTPWYIVEGSNAK